MLTRHFLTLIRTSNIASISSRAFCAEAENPVFKRIEEDVTANKLVVFMKGTPDQPQCGFSNAVIQALRMNGVQDIEGRNVLTDYDLREGIKKYSDWPTVPQVYINGEFIGGCDIVMNMQKNGELTELLRKEEIIPKE